MSILKEAERTVFLVNPRSPWLRLSFAGKTVGVPVGLGVVGSEVDRVLEQTGFSKEVDIKVVDEDLGQHVNPKPGDLVLTTSFSLTAKRTQAVIQKLPIKGRLPLPEAFMLQLLRMISLK